MSSSTANIIFTTNAEDTASQVDVLNTSLDRTGTAAAKGGALADTNWGRFGSTIGRVGVIGVVAMDRLEIAQEAVQNAQMRATLAQERYTAAVEKYGPASEQAKRAHQELEIAIRSVGIAQERENIRTLIMVGAVIPQMIAGVYRLIGMLGLWDKENKVLTISTITLTNAQRALLAASIVGIPLLIAGLALSTGAFGVGGGTTINHYGDVNLPGVQTPASFATDYTRTSRASG